MQTKDQHDRTVLRNRFLPRPSPNPRPGQGPAYFEISVSLAETDGLKRDGGDLYQSENRTAMKSNVF